MVTPFVWRGTCAMDGQGNPGRITRVTGRPPVGRDPPPGEVRRKPGDTFLAWKREETVLATHA